MNANKRGSLKQDLRSPLARARDEWLASDEGKRCLDGTASGVYLENRLQAAFIAGANAQTNITKKALPPDNRKRTQRAQRCH